MNQDKRPQPASEADSVDIHDRVAEAYYGLMGPKFMRDTQNRIHWICRQIQGKSVLDVGCSQGIVPILLAREGLKVIGIDSSPKAIDEANHYLASEPKQVRKNVSFVNSDFLSWDFHELKIDTVVMSEVLEHLTRPDSFIEAAARILAKRGRLVVTVPFGINDFIDHKHTFYLLKPLRLISRHFDLVDIEILGNWLGVVVDRRMGADRGIEPFRPTVELMDKLENAFYQTERILRDELSLGRTAQEEASRKYRGATEQITALKQRATEEEKVRQATEQARAQATTKLEAELDAARGRLEEANQKYRGAAEQISTLKQRVTEEEKARQAAEQALAQDTTKLEAELEAVHGRLEEANQKYRGVTEQVTALKQRVTQEEAVHSRLEEANQKYRGAIEQVTALKQRVTEEEKARQAAEQALAQDTTELKADLEAMRGRLEEANQKYREATEQVSSLKQRVTQEEAMQQGAEKARAQASAQLEEVQRNFQEERKVLQQQLAQLSEEGQAKTVTVHEGEKKLIRLEAELDARSRLEEANQKCQAATDQVSRLKQQVTQEEATRKTVEQALQAAEKKLAALDGELVAVRSRLEEANQKYREATEQVSTLKQRVTQEEATRKTAEQALQAAEKKLAALDGELVAVRSRLEEANQKYREATEQVSTLKQRVTQEETARQAVEQALAQATAQWEQTRSGLQAERAALQQQLVQLTAECQAKWVAVQEAEGKLLRLEGEQEETNKNYRNSTEQLAVLKQQVTQEEIARQAAEQALAKATTQLEQAQSYQQEEHAGLLQQVAQLSQQEQASRAAVEEANQKNQGATELLTALQQQLAQVTVEGQAKAVTAAEAAKNLLRLEAELEEARNKLGEANQKYRVAGEQITALRQRVTQEASARQANEQELRHTATQLEQANSKYRQLTRQVPDLKNKLEQQKLAARRQLEKTRSAISFRLGYLLIHNFKSVNGFLSLPSALWALRKETIRRRKLEPLPFAPSSPKLPSLSGPSSSFRPNVFIEPLSQEPQSNGRRALALTTEPPIVSASTGKLSIVCIMDEFTFGSFQPEACLHQLTPQNWRNELEAAKPDLLFIESAWRGKDELWGNKVGHTSAELQGIVEWCRAKHVPTVFWCKEDPIHFETFLNTAMLFDYVFTTDIDCIHRYKAALGHDRAYLLPFACQPATNNPIEAYQRKDAFCFAGAYYVRYPERTRDLGDFALELPAFRPLEIYDRNYGKNDPNYQFPAEYRQYIVGTLPFDQIDKAYKGYRYAINLNSIKQSQSMFARRVFELLASNTITISNFSRGLRLLFGDLVITTDSGAEIIRRLKKMADNDAQSRKLRLAALRKVMQEHTYGQRLAYIVSKVNGKATKQSLPHIAVLAYAGSQRELDSIQANYHRQLYADTSLYVVVDEGVTPPVREDARVHFVTSAQAQDLLVGGLASQAELVAGMVTEDYYGPNYLEDVALATRYTQADLIGKAARYMWAGGNSVQIRQRDDAYRPVQRLPARAAAVRRQVIAQENVLAWVQSLGTCQLQADQGLAIDEFNYCEYGAAADSKLIRETVDDLPGLNTGISIDDLLEIAEHIAPESDRHDDCPVITGSRLAGDFGKKPSAAITLAVDGQNWRIGSTLPDGKHEYLYATATRSVEELGFTEQLKLYFDVTPGLNIQLVVQFLDAQKQKISHVIVHANRNQQSVIPPGTVQVRLGLRFYASGHAEMKGLVLGRKNLEPAELIGQAEQLLLTNHYPSYDDLYRNGFVHTRVAAYAERGTKVDVFRLRPDEAVSYHEFEDVNVITGSKEVLHRMLSSGRYKSVAVHFLNSAMWDVLQHHIERIKVVVWVHGAEIQPWHRRDFNHQTEDERAVAKIQSEDRMTFWRDLLQAIPPNLKLVFVSRYFSEEVMEDLGFRIPEKHYAIIHNPINTELFSHQEKPVEQRKKVLSIRPYASAKYANDLSVKAIQRLSQEPWFYDLEFRMIGDGPLFEETLAPLREFKNVYIEQRFLNQAEIAALHKEYGIFLCPTRMDAQGVSRDEAMASGLVPVTNAVTAIPEFVDDNCGILAPGEDADAMAKGISLLYEQPLKFSAMSKAAASRVRAQSDAERIIGTELALISDDSEPIRYKLTA